MSTPVVIICFEITCFIPSRTPKPLLLIFKNYYFLLFLGFLAHFEYFLFKIKVGWTGSQALVAHMMKPSLVSGDLLYLHTCTSADRRIFREHQVLPAEHQANFKLQWVVLGVSPGSSSWFPADNFYPTCLRTTEKGHVEEKLPPLGLPASDRAVPVAQDMRGCCSLPSWECRGLRTGGLGGIGCFLAYREPSWH